MIILALILNPIAERRRRRLARENNDADRESQPSSSSATAAVIPADNGDGPSRESTVITSGLVSRQGSASVRTSHTPIEKSGDDERKARWDSISEKSCGDREVSQEKPG